MLQKISDNFSIGHLLLMTNEYCTKDKTALFAKTEEVTHVLVAHTAHAHLHIKSAKSPRIVN